MLYVRLWSVTNAIKSCWDFSSSHIYNGASKLIFKLFCLLWLFMTKGNSIQAMLHVCIIICNGQQCWSVHPKISTVIISLLSNKLHTMSPDTNHIGNQIDCKSECIIANLTMVPVLNSFNRILTSPLCDSATLYI